MDLDINNGRPVVRLRAFRAIEEPETCKRFIEGHKHVLESIGVFKVTSSSSEWMYNPAAFVFIVESLDKKKIYGGARIHVAGGTDPLPIEQATGHLDSTIYSVVREYAKYGVGEGCGLWNSREIAGYGIGSIFLSRAGVAIAKIIGIKTLLGLCAPYTVKLAENIGYRRDKGLGNNGTFYYPKIDLVATVMTIEDINNLDAATKESREVIRTLVENRKMVRIEELRRKEIEIHYEINIPNLDKWDLQKTIENALRMNNINNEGYNLSFF
jgi:hypothetical protein